LAAVVAEGVCPIVLLAAGRAEPDPGQSSELPLVGLQLLPKAVHILQDLLDVLAVGGSAPVGGVDQLPHLPQLQADLLLQIRDGPAELDAVYCLLRPPLQPGGGLFRLPRRPVSRDRKSTRLNSSHVSSSYAA